MTTRAGQVRWMGTAADLREATTLVTEPGDAVVVHRGRDRWLVLRCPCGCGEQISLNVDPQAGRAWRFHRRGERLTISPSIWRESGCRSHFFVWGDEIQWAYSFDDHEDEWAAPTSLVDSVADALAPSEFRSYIDVAWQLEESPRAVFAACCALVTAGRAEEGTGHDRGHFRRR